MALNAKQKKFCEVLVRKGLSASAAYKLIYNPKSSSAVTASSSKLLAKDSISEYIAHLQKKATDSTIMSRKEVLQRLTALGRGNLKSVATWTEDGLDIIPSEDLDDEESVSIQSIKHTISEFGGSVEIKQRDPIKALELLAKHHGALNGSDDDDDDNGNGKTSVDKVLELIRAAGK